MSQDLLSLLDRPSSNPATLVPAASSFINHGGIPLSNWTPVHLQHLVSAIDLSHSLSTPDRTILLTVVKLVAKHSKLNSPLYASEDFVKLAATAGITSHPNPAIPFPPDNDPAVNEARKVIANLILLERHAGTTILLAEQCLPRVLSISMSTTTSLESIFLIYRILFLFTASPEHVKPVLSAGVDHYSSLITRILATPESPPPYTRSAVLAEVLKTMFNLQSFSNVEPEYDSSADIFPASVMTILSTILTAFPLPSPPMSTPFSHVIHVLMCGPSKGWCSTDLATFLCSKMLQIECEQEVFPNGKLKGKPYTKLSVLTSDKSSPTSLPNEDISPGNRLPPLLHLLGQIYTAEYQYSNQSPVAAVIKQLLIPADLDRTGPIDEGRTLGHFVIRLLTYAESTSLREAAETLVFALCNKDASQMVAHIGLGPSAGFLVNHGLFSEDLLKNSGNDSNVNPITGQKEEKEEAAKAKAEWDKMTDEEKEREAEQLFVQFDKLNKLGIIKVLDPTTGQEVGPGK